MCKDSNRQPSLTFKKKKKTSSFYMNMYVYTLCLHVPLFCIACLTVVKSFAVIQNILVTNTHLYRHKSAYIYI